MKELNPFSLEENKKPFEIFENFNESVSESDYPMFEPHSSCSLDSYSFPDSSKKKFPTFPKKSIFLPQLFLDEKNIEIYKCGLCENICDDAVKSGCKCKSIFCRECLSFYFKQKSEKCPLCGKQTNGKIIKAEDEDMFIKSQKMKCLNYIYNCKWKGECEKYKDHINFDCPEETVSCPNKNHGCVIKMQRKNLLKHIKNCQYEQVKCEKCNLYYAIGYKNEHKEKCLMEEINCPHNCGERFIRKELVNHQNEFCDNFYVECPFKPIGCLDTFKKKEEKNKLNETVQKHLILLMNKILSVEENNFQNNKRANNKEKEVLGLKMAASCIQKETDMKNEENNNMALLSKKRKSELSSELSDDSILNKEEKKAENFSEINSNSMKISNIKENETPMSIEKEETNIYDLPEISKEFFYYENNIIEALDLKGVKQYYVFFNEKFDIPKGVDKEYKIKFSILSNAKSLYMGLCDKKVLEENKHESLTNDKSKEKIMKKKNNGIYYLNTNKMAWNCNNKSQCKNLSIQDVNEIGKKGDVFEFIINPSECELKINLNYKNIVHFNDVRCFKSKALSPFLIFIKNCKLKTDFDYK